MRLIWLVTLAPFLLQAQPDPATETYRAWVQQHSGEDLKTRAQSLLDVSADWVVKWPDSRLAWTSRRNSLLETQSGSPELWKQVDENLIRVNPPHTFAASAAYDWVAAHVNLKDAENLVVSEIAWLDGRPQPTSSAPPSLADLVDEAQFGSRVFGPLCTLASAQIQLKEFDGARATIARIRAWLDGDFKLHFDQDPLETVPDYEAKVPILSAQLAQAEGRSVDALAFWQKLITDPYFHREYGGFVKETRALWNQLGGAEEGWAAFSRVPALPTGVPAGNAGTSYPPWVALDYKLPELKLPGLDARTWTNTDFEGKSTFVYLWASWCAPCWMHLPVIQATYDATKDRRDIQIVTLSVDEDKEKLSAFMSDKKYTFPVVVSKAYADRLLPRMILGQSWIVDKTGTIRLQRTSGVVGRPHAEVDEAIYKLVQVSKR